MKNEDKIAVLGEKTSFKGSLTFDTHLKIKGNYNGSIKSKGILYVENTAYVEGNINVSTAVVAGHIIGDVTATDKIDIKTNSVIQGNLVAPIIKIADGVRIEGRCQMIQDAEAVDIFSTSVSQLKKSVEIV